MVKKDYATSYTSRKSGTLEDVVITFLGVVCFIASGFMFSYAILGGF